MSAEPPEPTDPALAGRQAPGQCIRLWTREQEASLPERRTPEIRSSDLSSLLVQVAAYGVEVNDLPLIAELLPRLPCSYKLSGDNNTSMFAFTSARNTPW